jgi:hypothetical protein
MFDPGAMGTLMIGLESIRRENERYDQGQIPARPRRATTQPELRVQRVRRRFASMVRRLAERLEPTPARAPAVRRG